MRGNWKWEVVKFSSYTAFPLFMFWAFNQPPVLKFMRLFDPNYRVPYQSVEENENAKIAQVMVKKVKKSREAENSFKDREEKLQALRQELDRLEAIKEIKGV